MKRSTSWIAVLPSLVIPVCVGLMLYLGMLALIQHDVIADATVLRYLTGHPVSKITVGMFLIGSASLLMIGFNVFEQFRSEKRICLSPEASPQTSHETEHSDGSVFHESAPQPTVGRDIGNEKHADVSSFFDNRADSGFSETTESHSSHSSAESPLTEHAIACGQSMLQLPQWMQDHYLWQRIVAALHLVYRTGSATNVEEELKYLADMDLERQQQRYSLVQILIWATPMLGFLGTVLGISQALGGITVGPENDFQQMMDGLRGSLYVAFDTTALALTLSMILMFGQFLVDRFESQLLQLVDQRARAEISGQFDLSALADKPQETVGDEIVAALKQSVQTQTETWRTTLLAAETAWTSSLTDVNGQVQGKLSASIDQSVTNLAKYLNQAIEKADHSMSHRWEQWQVLLSDNARQMSTHQTHLAEQTGLIHKLLTQTEALSSFEPAIRKNQAAIEQTEQLTATLAELSLAVKGLTKSSTDGTEPSQANSDSRLRPPATVGVGKTTAASHSQASTAVESVETVAESHTPTVDAGAIAAGSRIHDRLPEVRFVAPAKPTAPEVILPFSKNAA